MLSGMTRTRPQPTPATDATAEDLRLLTEREVSELLSVPLQTLRNHRSLRRGVPFVRFGRAVRYRLADVRAFVAARMVNVSNREGR